MTPLICFYKDLFLWSERYLYLEKPADLPAEDFLNEVQRKYADQTKIIQIDFEAFQPQTPQKTKYYQSTGVQIFVIQDKTLLSKEDLEKKLHFHSTQHPEFTLETSKELFCKKVQNLVHEINRGRFYQVNLTSAFTAPIAQQANSLQLFANYFAKFKPQYPAFLSGSKFDILCLSPELFLKKQGTHLMTRPIKGTTTGEFKNLINNPKEAAELSMIVDLLRNDLNSVASTSAVVTKHREKLQLPYTTHTYSEVTVETKKQFSEILKATMPGGSISGCPKIESLKAIAEFEDYQRQVYTGTIGWWEQNDFELNIAIRSFVRADTRLHYFAGCGIVSESDPESEWNELLNKASALKLNHTN